MLELEIEMFKSSTPLNELSELSDFDIDNNIVEERYFDDGRKITEVWKYENNHVMHYIVDNSRVKKLEIYSQGQLIDEYLIHDNSIHIKLYNNGNLNRTYNLDVENVSFDDEKFKIQEAEFNGGHRKLSPMYWLGVVVDIASIEEKIVEYESELNSNQHSN